MPKTRSRLIVAVFPVLVILLAGCAVQPATPNESAAAPRTAATMPPPTATVAPATGRPGIEAPPDAELSVEGGDPVTGRLGTFVWGGGGSDSPWLPGPPIRAATGETMRVTLSPDVVVSGWSGLLASAANTGGEGAVTTGSGSAVMDVTAPGAGSWTLAVTITFGDLGSATYSWLLEVL
jgi:hypothetical protein